MAWLVLTSECDMPIFGYMVLSPLTDFEGTELLLVAGFQLWCGVYAASWIF